MQNIVALLVAALLLGLVLHPFQFSMTQLLEGYWGRSCIGLGLARRRIMHYRRTVQALNDAAKKAEHKWVHAVECARTTEDRIKRESSQRRQDMNAVYLDKQSGDLMLADYLHAQALREALGQYPDAGAA
jgi:hypothetical protein